MTRKIRLGLSKLFQEKRSPRSTASEVLAAEESRIEEVENRSVFAGLTWCKIENLRGSTIIQLLELAVVNAKVSRALIYVHAMNP